MTDFLKEFQNSACQLAPMVLVLVGFVLTWQGLCLWLGGLRWLKFFAGFVAAAIGYTLAYFLTDHQIYFLIGGAVLAGLLAIFFEKTTVILLTAVLTAAAVNLFMAWPTLNNPQTWQNPPAVNISVSSQTGDMVVQSLTVLENYAAWIGQNAYNAVKSLGKMSWIACAVVILTVVGLGFAIPRGICAFVCATLGTMFIAVGMFFLLLYKGSKPADIFLANPGLFAIAVAVMIVFGILINLAVAPAPARKKAVASSS